MIPCKAIPWEPFPNSKNTLFLFKRSVVILWDKPPPGGLCKPGWAHSSSPVYDWPGRLVFMTCRWFHCQKVRGAHSEHWGRAAFKGLTALMTESSAAHHAAFLRDNALRLTCGSHRAGRSTAETHTPTRDRFSISTWLAVPPSPDVSLCFRGYKRFYAITACVCLTQRKSSAHIMLSLALNTCWNLIYCLTKSILLCALTVLVFGHETAVAAYPQILCELPS